MVPLTSSTGHEAHQPSTATRPPVAVTMFQRAGTRRRVDDTGWSPLAVGTTNSVMPCTSGMTPVATEVQITGEAW